MLPIMKNIIRLEEKSIKQFKGINVGENYSPEDIYDEVNMSSAMYPALCSGNSGKVTESVSGNITGIENYDGIIFTYYDSDGKMFLNYQKTDYEFTAFTKSAPEEKRKLASLNDSVLIIPDNLIFTPSSGEFKEICVNQTGNYSSAEAKYLKENGSGSPFDNTSYTYIGKVSTNSIYARMNTYRADGEDCRFYFTNFSPILEAGDVITVKMTVASEKADNTELFNEYRNKMENGITLKIKDIEKSGHYTGKEGYITETIGLIFDDNAIDNGGYTDLTLEKFTIERTMPELRDICSFNNRIWGITKRELCCSKLGDASEWNDFTVDAYGTLPYACFSSPAPTEGDFTAVLSLGNYIYAFKENVVHKLYGDTPDEFVLKTTELSGVPKERSMTIAKTDSEVFYCSYDGIYRFDGNGTELISRSLGDGFDFKCGGSDGKKYYVCAKQEDGEYVYVYDIRHRIWHREDFGKSIRMLCRSGGSVYASTQDCLMQLNCDNTKDTSSDINWNFSIRFDEKQFEKRGFGKISIRYSLGKDAFFTVRAIYDDNSGGAVCGARHDEVFDGGGFMKIPLKRCRNFRLKFKGNGFFCLKSLKLQYYRGSEI